MPAHTPTAFYCVASKSELDQCIRSLTNQMHSTKYIRVYVLDTLSDMFRYRCTIHSERSLPILKPINNGQTILTEFHTLLLVSMCIEDIQVRFKIL